MTAAFLYVWSPESLDSPRFGMQVRRRTPHLASYHPVPMHFPRIRGQAQNRQLKVIRSPAVSDVRGTTFDSGGIAGGLFEKVVADR